MSLSDGAVRVGKGQTPEQRARRAVFDNPLTINLIGASTVEVTNHEPLEAAIAAEIRAAVEAEREECASIVTNDMSNPIAANRIAERIRSRTAPRAEGRK